jgi:hypothetical protein
MTWDVWTGRRAARPAPKTSQVAVKFQNDWSSNAGATNSTWHEFDIIDGPASIVYSMQFQWAD